ncbi:hypothetical protein CI238_13103 [Colletotrichum incanum]|uniref:Methyltransferase domain-containing protein n=1 Tax=Colletotrichum incanum TaxID=1573173 RepID=A0A167AVY6_COLIC|nr:hypothetical protein CI238_13103 [Colletotrichum incanum]
MVQYSIASNPPQQEYRRPEVQNPPAATEEEAHKDGLDLLHQVFMTALNGKFFQLRPKPNSLILDDETRTGIWAIGAGEEIQAIGGEVFGFSALNLQPDHNVCFYLGNRETLWARGDRFDLIHTRVLPDDMRNWPDYYKKAYGHLNVGGTLEIEALNLELFWDCEEPTFNRNWFLDHLTRAPTYGDKQYLNFKYTKQLLENAGFRDIKETTINLPINPVVAGNTHRQKLGNHFNFGLQVLFKIRDFTPPGSESHPPSFDWIYSLRNRAYCKLVVWTAKKPLGFWDSVLR